MQTAPRQKILVVDDDLRLRDLLKRYLSEQGFAVDTVPDAAAMDRSLARVRYDLIVLDLMLPGEDGLASGQFLQSCPQLKHRGIHAQNLKFGIVYPDSARIRRSSLPNGAIRILPNG